MGRPRAFDEDEVLDRALEVFWARGFDGTSVAELEAATGLVRTSLYGAFGDKEGLFVRVLERFRDRYDRFAELALTGEPARAGLEAAFRVWLDDNCAARSPRGCLLQLATTTGAAELPRVSALIRASAAATQATFERALARAARRGELPAGPSIPVRARYLVVTVQGLSSAARSGMSRGELEEVVALALDAVFGPAEPAPRRRRAAS